MIRHVESLLGHLTPWQELEHKSIHLNESAIASFELELGIFVIALEYSDSAGQLVALGQHVLARIFLKQHFCVFDCRLICNQHMNAKVSPVDKEPTRAQNVQVAPLRCQSAKGKVLFSAG